MKDAQVKLSTREDKDFLRTAIVVEAECSVDVVDNNNDLLCRINLFHRDQSDWVAVDVIWDKTVKKGKVLAWKEGDNVLNEELPNSSLVSVDICRR